jgi:hypothetical protein
MKTAAAKKPQAVPEEGKKITQSTPLTLRETGRLKTLRLRFQELVVLRNKRMNEEVNANVDASDIMRAGLLALEKTPDEDFRGFVIGAKDRN